MVDLTSLSPELQRILMEGPALKPPPGVQPNFVDPENRNALGYGVILSTSTIATLLTFSRLYVRYFYHNKLNIEDALMIFQGAYAGFMYVSWKITSEVGCLVHQWNVRLKDLPHFLYYINTGSAVYGNVIMSLKVGVLLHWSKIFVPLGNRNGFWWTCHITLWVNVVLYVICTFLEIFGCTPREKLWNPFIQGKCFDMGKLNIVTAAINFVSDVIILFLPQKVIWGLQMSTNKKIGVAVLFATGIFAIVSAGHRINSSISFANNEDVVYYATEMGLWCIGEMISGFFVLCLPVLPKLFADWLWVRKTVSALKSFSRSSSGSHRSMFSGIATPFTSSRRKQPDASLFTETDEFGLVSLPGPSTTMEYELRSDKIDDRSVSNREISQTLES
ncbi:hypothetical protein CC78DRAFT_524205 [Lojkania enalia]|uniref:Rhodopsin domain-containing protein n=1 Tax=Lojkania enalia TaxID=147567 RepID=A0A9P4K0B3_9PLEO|nr:hypothetical protein CC78DRAFT_524205 [Didymosphaeria enalia]